MTRRKLIAANWKMHKTIAEAEAFVDELIPQLPSHGGCDLLLCPPFFAVPFVAAKLAGTAVEVGAQDLYWEAAGAYTGEISAPMIADSGARYVIVGHSERRHLVGESDDVVARKLAAALDGGLVPILCVGETIGQREGGQAEDTVGGQLDAALAGLERDKVARVIIAYEPVWAIGTGKTATPDDAEAMHRFVRLAIAQHFDEALAESLQILYGGSVKPDNAGGLLQRKDIDGGLIGGASLDVGSFLAIAASA